MKKLGFGLMRLPKINGEIDIEQVKSMADAFLSNGFTYFDTAYVYENSEVAFNFARINSLAFICVTIIPFPYNLFYFHKRSDYILIYF